MRDFLKKQRFILWLLAGVLLAICFPAPAATGGVLHAEVMTQIGVFLIFLLQGLSLPTSELASGYHPKRLHAFVLSWNYLWCPLVIGLLLLPGSLILPASLCLGFGLLAILPTTVSSAVTFTAVSGGNTSNAIFSTVFSNLLAVLIVPAVAVTYLSVEADASVPLLPLFSKLFTLIVLPLLIGQVARKALPACLPVVAKFAKGISNWIIIFIVHAAFADSVQSGFLDTLSGSDIVAVILSTLVVLLVVSALVWWSSRRLSLNRSQQIAAFFCASQKSLATGLPLATSILAAAPGVVDGAAVLIPLMCYHPMQLVLAGVLSSYLSGDE